MATFKDLALLPYFGKKHASVLRAIGWLGFNSKYEKGPTDGSVYRRLESLMSTPFQPVVSAGFHECELCQFDGVSGSANLFVPGDGFLYVCPELITHYINAHAYKPPDEFCAAVLACPDTRSMEYKKMFLGNGGRALLSS